MKTQIIGALCALAMLTSAASVASAQQSRPTQAQKAPSAEAKAEKKPNIVVFQLSGTPQATQKPGRPKGVPALRPLSNDEKIRIVQQIPGLPHTFSSVTPYVTLSPLHVLDPRGALDLHWPAVTSWASATYGTFPLEEGQFQTFNAKNVEVYLAADKGNVYYVDFAVWAFSAFDFQVTAPGLPPPPPPPSAQPGENHVAATVGPISASGIYRVTLQVRPPSGGGGGPYPEWVFEFVEVTKFVPSS